MITILIFILIILIFILIYLMIINKNIKRGINEVKTRPLLNIPPFGKRIKKNE